MYINATFIIIRTYLYYTSNLRKIIRLRNLDIQIYIIISLLRRMGLPTIFIKGNAFVTICLLPQTL